MANTDLSPLPEENTEDQNREDDVHPDFVTSISKRPVEKIAHRINLKDTEGKSDNDSDQDDNKKPPIHD